MNTEKWLDPNDRSAGQFLAEVEDAFGIGRERFDRLFVFSHRLPWALCDERFADSGLDAKTNAPLAETRDRERMCALYQRVLALAGGRPLYWFGGDVGTSSSFSAGQDHFPENDQHFIACGLGDRPSDQLVRVVIPREGPVRLQFLSLTGASIQPPVAARAIQLPSP